MATAEENMPSSGAITMEDRIGAASYALEQFLEPEAQGVPAKLMAKCKGAIIMNVTEASCGLTGATGTGILMRHDTETQTWSPPIAINRGGMGFGLAVGFKITNYLLLFTDDKQLKELASGHPDKMWEPEIGATVAQGPTGRNRDVVIGSAAKVFTYSSSSGFFAGAKISKANLKLSKPHIAAEYYGSIAFVSNEDILFKEGCVTVPEKSKLPYLHKQLKRMAAGATGPVVASTNSIERGTTEASIMTTEEESFVKEESMNMSVNKSLCKARQV